MRFHPMIFRVAIICLLSVCITFHAHSQKGKFYALVYKYKEGDKYRITTSTYKNFSTTSQSYNNSFSGETSFDLYQEVEGADDEACDMKVRFELTRHTENGKNMTYKLPGVFKGDELMLTFDRFGKILPKSIEYHSGDSTNARAQEQLSLFRNIFIPLPDRALKTGDTWDVSDVFDEDQLNILAGSSYGMKKPDVRGQYLLESVEDGKAKIALDLEISGNGRLSELRDSAEFDILLRITGTFNFDVVNGKVLDGNINTEAAGVTKIGQQKVDFKGSLMSTFTIEKYK